jgi:hypothetical protein
MSKIGLIVNINKFNKCFETSNATFVCDSDDEAKNKMIEHLVTYMGSLNIDYPMDLDDFEYVWFKQNYVKTNAFTYFIFNETKWHQPWDLQEIYEEFLDKMVEKDSSNPPDFDTIYGEPNPDEEEEDKFTMEHSEEVQELEKKLSEIISNAKNVNIHEDTVKDCDCDRCKEGCELQTMRMQEEKELAKNQELNKLQEEEANKVSSENNLDL